MTGWRGTFTIRSESSTGSAGEVGREALRGRFPPSETTSFITFDLSRMSDLTACEEEANSAGHGRLAGAKGVGGDTLEVSVGSEVVAG